MEVMTLAQNVKATGATAGASTTLAPNHQDQADQHAVAANMPENDCTTQWRDNGTTGRSMPCIHELF
jgi:hypothetical protein